jgi:hypothetical protein
MTVYNHYTYLEPEELPFGSKPISTGLLLPELDKSGVFSSAIIKSYV